MSTSGLLKAVALVSVLGFATVPTVVNAWGGCGWGGHRGPYGGCVSNYYGGGWGWRHNVVYRPYYHHCWRNRWGYVRCGY